MPRLPGISIEGRVVSAPLPQAEPRVSEALATAVLAEQAVWRAKDAIEFFTTHRRSIGDLYPSEWRFLPEVVPLIKSVLDVGCAAGGFSQIMRSFNPNIAYTGVDVIQEFVTLARRLHPESRFELGEGVHFSTPPESYDLVHSSGILHVNSRYHDIVSSCYAQAKRYLLCDFRLTDGPTARGTLRLDFDERHKPRPDLPYIVLNRDELLADLTALTPAPKSIRLYGYPSPPTRMATIPLDEVTMTFVLVEKGSAQSDGPVKIDWEIVPAPPST